MQTVCISVTMGKERGWYQIPMNAVCCGSATNIRREIFSRVPWRLWRNDDRMDTPSSSTSHDLSSWYAVHCTPDINKQHYADYRLRHLSSTVSIHVVLLSFARGTYVTDRYCHITLPCSGVWRRKILVDWYHRFCVYLCSFVLLKLSSIGVTESVMEY